MPADPRATREGDAALLRAAMESAGERTHAGIGAVLGMDRTAIGRVLAGRRALDEQARRLIRAGIAHPAMWEWLREASP